MADGVTSTARIITGAALIIVAVFAGCARGQLLQFQETGSAWRSLSDRPMRSAKGEVGSWEKRAHGG